MSVAPRQAICCLLLAVLLGLAGGCGQERQPPPIHRIVLLSDPGLVEFDGERIGEAVLRRELAAIADASRRHVTGTGRARIAIVSSLGANDRRAQDLARYCMSIGLHSVYFQDR